MRGRFFTRTFKPGRADGIGHNLRCDSYSSSKQIRVLFVSGYTVRVVASSSWGNEYKNLATIVSTVPGAEKAIGTFVASMFVASTIAWLE